VYLVVCRWQRQERPLRLVMYSMWEWQTVIGSSETLSTTINLPCMKTQKGTFPFNMNLFDVRWKNLPDGMARYTMPRRDSDFTQVSMRLCRHHGLTTSGLRSEP
jgi:hypothetical protein